MAIQGSNGKCRKCGGSGILPQFSRVQGGICFTCGGSGQLPELKQGRREASDGYGFTDRPSADPHPRFRREPATRPQGPKIPDTSRRTAAADRGGWGELTVLADSLKDGEDLEGYIETQIGRVQFLAEVKFQGDQVSLENITIYSDVGETPNLVGARVFIRLRDAVAKQASRQGFATMRLSGKRVAGSSSANPGHSIAVTVNLRELK